MVLARFFVLTTAAFCLLLSYAALAVSSQAASTDVATQSWSIMPPGQSGQIPPAGSTSDDQLHMYDNFTSLFDDVKASDISEQYFKPAPLSGGTDLATSSAYNPGKKGITVKIDKYGVPHIYGSNRSDIMYTLGYVTAKDRGFILEALRGAAILASLDAPNIDPFKHANSLGRFEASKSTVKRLKRQRKTLTKFAGKKEAKRILKDMRNYTQGINQFYREGNNPAQPWTVEDVTATAALIGKSVGQGGGQEVKNANLLASLQNDLGGAEGLSVFRDLRSTNDPEAPVTSPGDFEYAGDPTGDSPGSVVIDEGSEQTSTKISVQSKGATVPRSMSNALLVSGARSATGKPLFVAGPQTGYYEPHNIYEFGIHGGGLDARGVTFPGLPYVLMGRTGNYSWSATTARSDNVDQFVEKLCKPGGGTATRSSKYYVYKGKCRKMRYIDAGVITISGKAQKLTYYETVHGPVSSTVTVGGAPYAVATRRSSRGRELLQALPFSALDSGKAKTAKDFIKIEGRGGELTFNWLYANSSEIAHYSAGRLPIRAEGVDPSLPTLGTGKYDWRGYISIGQHPHVVNPSTGVLVNFNNKPAAKFAAADNNWSFGSAYRSQLLEEALKGKNELQDVVAAVNKTGTQDLRTVKVWPIIDRVLGEHGPDARTERAAQLINEWRASGSSRLDRDGDGKIDYAGAAVIDKAWDKLAKATLRPVLGDNTELLADTVNPIDIPPSSVGASFHFGWYGYVHKDLRSLLGEEVRGPYSRIYCGNGNLQQCRDSLWAVLKEVSDELATEQGDDPDAWRADATAERIKFIPGFQKQTMQWTNRPAFQQIIQY